MSIKAGRSSPAKAKVLKASDKDKGEASKKELNDEQFKTYGARRYKLKGEG